MALKWQDLITERDGSTPCFVRLLTFLGVAGYIALTGWAIAHGQYPSYTEWGVGFATILGAGAGSARLKLETENAADDDDEDCDDNHSGADRSWEK